MATSVRLDDSLVEDAQMYANATSRSVPKQIEHWAKLGRTIEDNPDLPLAFVLDAMLARAEIESGKGDIYVRRKNRRR
jgi:hypothetical protein